MSTYRAYGSFSVTRLRATSARISDNVSGVLDQSHRKIIKNGRVELCTTYDQISHVQFTDSTVIVIVVVSSKIETA